MLTEKEIENNKNEFIELISKVERDGFDKEGLINKLNNSDFFIAPASSKYHCAYSGGLCEHSLNVYYNLIKIINSKDNLDKACYSEDSVIVSALLHDISKMNFYEQYFSNKKVYCDDGDKVDNLGKFKWVSVPSWKQRDEKFVYGSHEMASEFIARQFIPLTLDESVAILHHMGGRNWDSAQDNISCIFGQYQLAFCLHMADMMATYLDEGD